MSGIGSRMLPHIRYVKRIGAHGIGRDLEKRGEGRPDSPSLWIFVRWRWVMEKFLLAPVTWFTICLLTHKLAALPPLALVIESPTTTSPISAITGARARREGLGDTLSRLKFTP